VDSVVFLAQETGGFNRAELMFERGHEWRAMFEHHALQGFQVELELADLPLLGEEKLVNILIHVPIP
jgi:hypothetical protein